MKTANEMKQAIVIHDCRKFRELADWQSVTYTLVTPHEVTLHNSTVGNVRRYIADRRRQKLPIQVKNVRVLFYGRKQ